MIPAPTSGWYSATEMVGWAIGLHPEQGPCGLVGVFMTQPSPGSPPASGRFYCRCTVRATSTRYSTTRSLSITGNRGWSDNCDADVDVSFVDTYTTSGDCTPIVITRTFTAVDDKGNSSTCEQTITLNQ